MSVLVFGGSGFIGRRLLDVLAARGERVVCADITAPGGQTEFVRCDLRRFDDVIATTLAIRPTRTVNLAYLLGGDHDPHQALQLNVIGMDNFFEASRLAGVRHVVFGSSLVVNGKQSWFGERLVTETDVLYGLDHQYAVHKVFNERQAQDYRDKHVMTITSVRVANVTGHDKAFGMVDHVLCITQPAQGRAVSFPYADTMRCPVHVDDVAEAFARITLAEQPGSPAYNTGGTAVSLGELADIVRNRVPDARISFDHDTGGKAASSAYLIDNSRLRDDFGFRPRSAAECVDTILKNIREQHPSSEPQ